MLTGFCTCKVRNILTLISFFSVCRWLMELQVSSMLPLSFRQVVFYFCLELTGVIIRSMPEMASEAIRERTRERAAKPRERQRSFLSPPLAPASPCACVSRVISCDSPKWRACSQAKACLLFLKHLVICLALVFSKQ